MHPSSEATRTLFNTLVLGAYQRVLKSASRAPLPPNPGHTDAHISPLERRLWDFLCESPTPGTANDGTLEALWDERLERLAQAFLQTIIADASPEDSVLINQGVLRDHLRRMIGRADLFRRFRIRIGHASIALAQMADLLFAAIEEANILEVEIGDHVFRFRSAVPQA